MATLATGTPPPPAWAVAPAGAAAEGDAADAGDEATRRVCPRTA